MVLTDLIGFLSIAYILIIDCNHFESEDIFKDVMKRFLDDIDDISVIKSRININPFSIL